MTPLKHFAGETASRASIILNLLGDIIPCPSRILREAFPREYSTSSLRVGAELHTECMATNLPKERSYAFALRIIKVSRNITVEQKEYVLSKQLLRSGTSIGANIEEAFQGQSRADFISKLSIANKEAFETNYWLRLMRDSSMLTAAHVDGLLQECDEIQRMLIAAIKTSKSKL